MNSIYGLPATQAISIFIEQIPDSLNSLPTSGEKLSIFGLIFCSLKIVAPLSTGDSLNLIFPKICGRRGNPVSGFHILLFTEFRNCPDNENIGVKILHIRREIITGLRRSLHHHALCILSQLIELCIGQRNHSVILIIRIQIKIIRNIELDLILMRLAHRIPSSDSISLPPRMPGCGEINSLNRLIRRICMHNRQNTRPRCPRKHDSAQAHSHERSSHCHPCT